MYKFKQFNILNEQAELILEDIGAYNIDICEECGKDYCWFVCENEFQAFEPKTAPKKISGKEMKGLEAEVGPLAKTSKMPSRSASLPTSHCNVGSKLAKIPGSVCHNCYANKGQYTFPVSADAGRRRLEGLKSPNWVPAMSTLVKGQAQRSPEGHKFFRWHDSGDIQGPEHFEKILQVARNTPEVKHWLPTHEGKVVSDHIAKHGRESIPSNMNVRISANMVGDKPPTWPKRLGITTSTVHAKHGGVPGAGVETHSCPAYKQGGSCGNCRACWDKTVDNVSYPKH